MPEDELPEDELPDELSDELPESLPESLPQYSGTEPDSDYTPPGSPPGSTPSTPPPRRRRAFTEEGEFFDLLAFGNSHGVSAVAVGAMCEIEDTPPQTGNSTCTEHSMGSGVRTAKQLLRVVLEQLF